MNFSEAVTETYGIDFTLYTVTETDPSQNYWQITPGGGQLTGVTDGESVKAAALDYIRNGTRDVPVGTWIYSGGDQPSYKILAVTPAQ